MRSGRVAIQYRAASGELTERHICPYFLEVSRSEPASYVIAHDDLHGVPRTFKLERVVAAEMLDESYTILDDFDLYSYLAAAWGCDGRGRGRGPCASRPPWPRASKKASGTTASRWSIPPRAAVS